MGLFYTVERNTNGLHPKAKSTLRKWLMILGIMWKEQNVQTFFSGSNRAYFAVQSMSQGASTSIAVGALKSVLEAAKEKDGEAKSQNNIVERSTNWRTESNPWLRRTGWIEIFEGKNMMTLVNYTSNKGSDVHETSLIAGVKRVMERCMNGVRDIEHRGWSKIRFWLQSIETERPDGQPFRMYYADLATYTNIWIELILFCWRSHDDPDGVKLDESQTLILGRLRNLMHDSEEDTDKNILDIIDELLIEFCLSLITHSDFKQRLSAIRYYASVKGYHLSQGRWKSPGEYTPLLAAIQFGIRIIGLEGCLPIEDRGKYIYDEEHDQTGNTPLHIFRRFHGRWLVMSEPSPFAWVHGLILYGRKAAENDRGKRTVQIMDDGKWGTLSGRPFELPRYKCMIENALRQAERVLSRELLFRDVDTIENINPFGIYDDEGTIYFHF
jgi:hypothetical protein